MDFPVYTKFIVATAYLYFQKIVVAQTVAKHYQFRNAALRYKKKSQGRPLNEIYYPNLQDLNNLTVTVF